MAEKILNTRIQLKYDLYSNWTTKNPVLKAGEMAIATIASGNTQTANSVATPQVLIKVGDGSSHYNDLKFISGMAADVYGWAKADKKPSYNADEIEGLAEYIAGEIEDTDTQYQIVAGADAYTYKLQSKALGATSWTDVSTISIPKYDDREVKTDILDLQNLVGTTAVATQIANAIDALDLANTYDAKGAAATAESNAKKYTDDLANGTVKSNSDKIAALVGSDTNKSVRSIAEEVAAAAVESAGHLKREIVTTLPEASAADADTIYMVKDASVASGDAYKEYMLIGGQMVQIGDTTVSLDGYATEKYVDDAVTDAESALVGADTDTADANTIKGAKKHADAVRDDLEALDEANKVRDVSAGTGLKVTTTDHNAKIDFDDTVTFIFDCGDSTNCGA